MRIIRDNTFRNIQYTLMWLQFLTESHNNQNNLISEPFEQILNDFAQCGCSRYYETSGGNSPIFKKKIKIIRALECLHLVTVTHTLVNNDSGDDEDNTSYMRILIHPTQLGYKIFTKLSHQDLAFNNNIDSDVHFEDMSKHDQHRVIVGWLSMPMIALCVLGLWCLIINTSTVSTMTLVLFFLLFFGVFIFIGMAVILANGTYDGLRQEKYDRGLKKLLKQDSKYLPKEAIMTRFLIKHELISKYIAQVNDKVIRIFTNLMFVNKMN